MLKRFSAPLKTATGLAEMIHDCTRVSDLDCVVGCRRLVYREAILTGGSSGGVLMAAEKAKSSIPQNSNCVVILPDRGERYLDTVYSDTWVKKHFGDVSYLWQGNLQPWDEVVG